MGTTILSEIDDVIDDIKIGKPIIVVDDEGRENEGDLIVAADKITPETINFMAKYGRGLICLPLEKEIYLHLGLERMGRGDNALHRTAFTASIEAKTGVTTGISAADRARTIQVAVDPASSAQDIATPGHVFPLMARDGGVLERDGHTEAAVDLAKLAGFRGAGVICEIMNDDGTMARMDDLVVFARDHGLKIISIADLIAYRYRHELFFQASKVDDAPVNISGLRKLGSKLQSPCTWHVLSSKYIAAMGAENKNIYQVMVYGDAGNIEAYQQGQAVPVYLHQSNLRDDFFARGEGASAYQCIQEGLQEMAEQECGIFIFANDPVFMPVGTNYAMKNNQFYYDISQILKYFSARKINVINTKVLPREAYKILKFMEIDLDDHQSVAKQA